VFAAELALVTLVTSASAYCTSYALDRRAWSPRALSLVLGLTFCVPGGSWLMILSRWREGPLQPVTPPAGVLDGDDAVLEGRIG
jgi:hypothetical protein